MKIKSIAKNQTELHIKKNNKYLSDIIIFFSYQTPVACHIQGQGFFKTAEKWSVTTSKHISKWLDGATAQVKNQSFFNNLMEVQIIR